MQNEVQLSKKSQDFLENLRVYLFSSGKKWDEIDGIVSELESHLYKAEKDGKNIEKIIGKSPKEYMEMISNEMAIDYRSWFKYICLIIFGAYSITIFPDLVEGNLSYSILEIVGYLAITIIFIVSVFTGYRYLAKMNPSIKMQGVILCSITLVPMILFIGLIFLNKSISSPIIYFSNTGSFIIGLISALIIIGMSLWAKTWLLIIIVTLLTLPNYVLSLTSLSYETQLILSSIITFGGIGIYLWGLSRVESNKK